MMQEKLFTASNASQNVAKEMLEAIRERIAAILPEGVEMNNGQASSVNGYSLYLMLTFGDKSAKVRFSDHANAVSNNAMVDSFDCLHVSGGLNDLDQVMQALQYFGLVRSEQVATLFEYSEMELPVNAPVLPNQWGCTPKFISSRETKTGKTLNKYSTWKACRFEMQYTNI